MIKRGLIVLISGVLLEALALWASDRFYPWGLKNVNWGKKLGWVLFFAGFFSAYWLVLWGRFINRFFFKTKTATPAVKPTTPATTPTVQAAPTTNAAPAITATPTTTTAPNTPKPQAAAPSPMQQRPPAPMAVQNGGVLNVKPAAMPMAAPTPTVTSAPMTSNPAMASVTPATTTSTIPASTASSSKNSDISMLASLDLDLDMMPFKHVALEGKVLDLVYSSDYVAVLCKLLSDTHTWSVDISQPIENCVWTDESGNTSQPCAAVLTQAAILEKMEPDATIIPTLVLMRGKIQNYQEVENYLLQNHITLVKYEKGDEPQARLLTDLLQQKFGLFPSEDGFEDIPEEDIEDEEDLEQEEQNEQEQETTQENPS